VHLLLQNSIHLKRCFGPPHHAGTVFVIDNFNWYLMKQNWNICILWKLHRYLNRKVALLL